MMSATNGPTAPLLQACAVSVQYAGRRRFGRRASRIHAVRDVSLAVLPGATLGIVGESGSGKSTLARCLAGLESPSSGEVRINGTSFGHAEGGQLTSLRHQVQLVFQDSATAINPRFTVAEVIAEPLIIAGRNGIEERRRRVAELMAAVELTPQMAARRPHQLSGGQRQRVAIARALALRPSVLVLDEAFTGLDLPVQQRIWSLLAAMQQQYRLTYVLISHDFRLVAAVADEIAVMHAGAIVERGGAARVLSQPEHAQTRRLIEAIPARSWRFAAASR